MGRAEWLEERRKGIGGSDVSAILGLNPWKKPIDVFLEKKGLLEDTLDPNRQFLMQLGQDLEPVIARLYERQTQKKLTLPFPVRWVHRTCPVLGATPDRFIEGESVGVELKSESQFSDKFGDPGTDEVPAHYLLQVAHYMNVLDYDSWDIALLHAGTTFAVYTVKRDKELEAAVTEKLLAWWDKYIVKDTPPEVDGSEGWSKYLKKKFPVNTGAMLKATDEESKMVDLLRMARYAREKYDAHAKEIENRLKYLIGEHEGITGSFGKITWKKTKDTESVDWELAYKDFLGLVAPAIPIEMLEKAATIQGIHTMPRQGVRRFLLSEAKGLSDDRDAAKDRNLPDAPGEIQAGDRAGAAEAPERGQDGADRPYLLPQKP